VKYLPVDSGKILHHIAIYLMFEEFNERSVSLLFSTVDIEALEAS
jgi:hypothetical protein